MHDVESQGSKPRDHVHRRHSILRQPHRDWRVWVVALLMVGLMLVYVFSNDLSRRPAKSTAAPPTPALGGP